jgi:hypothetical protein
MSVDFEAVKRIPIPQILARFKIQLRYRGEWASAPCPLPTHKQDDKNRSFSVNVKDNYWKCFSESCNKGNEGRRGGDAINLVASLERINQRDAAQRLSDWFGEKKPAVPKDSGAKSAASDTSSDSPQHLSNSTGSGNGKGFMGETNLWLDEVLKPVPEQDRAMVKKLVAAKIYDSYQNGRKAK